MITIEFLDGLIREYQGCNAWEIEGPVVRLNNGVVLLLKNIRGWELQATQIKTETENNDTKSIDG